MHAVLVARGGRLIAELYRRGDDRSLYDLWSSCADFGPTDRHDMRSISKSVVALVYGSLLARGEVPDPSARVVASFPDEPDFADPGRRAIRLRDLLTMSTGLDWDEPSPVRRAAHNDETALIWSASAFRTVFAHEVVAAPGARFVYSGGATAVLAEIMTRATGRSLTDLVDETLFRPLGIVDWAWVENLHGMPLAAAGLRLRPRDLMKIGLMMLDHGRWQGRSIIPSAWIDEMITPRIAVGVRLDYGYQWWRQQVTWQGRALPVVAAIGNGGQRLFLVPDLDLAVVTTGGAYGDPAIGPVLDRLLRDVVDTIGGAVPAS
ncbi:serine hydrolase [Tistrella sp. BH-R2-4]|uniref:Serine hydrolase n=1 Tax=Tistrella arctica TaxID=3133430 RepID=A0ABU9YDU9_9PROT